MAEKSTEEKLASAQAAIADKAKEAEAMRAELAELRAAKALAEKREAEALSGKASAEKAAKDAAQWKVGERVRIFLTDVIDATCDLDEDGLPVIDKRPIAGGVIYKNYKQRTIHKRGTVVPAELTAEVLRERGWNERLTWGWNRAA